MDPFSEQMLEYQKQIKRGVIQQAYRGLMSYLSSLRTYLAQNNPNYYVSSLYFGYMDMTYFSFTPPSLKKEKLKIAIVFLHESCRFETWLAANNKKVQTKYWQFFKALGWGKYPIVTTPQGEDAILTLTLIEKPDFSNLNGLTEKIEEKVLAFIADVEAILSEHKNKPLRGKQN
jgi:hypothetical protein